MRGLDLKAWRFERLLVIEKTSTRRNGKIVWKCLCDCGTETYVAATDLRAGNTKSCGCLRVDVVRELKRKNTYPPVLNKLYDSYGRNAHKRNRLFEIPITTFLEIIKSNCYYCGQSPRQFIKDIDVHYFYNGLDRCDNTKGYIVSNVVACCGTCNKIKHTLGQKEFVEKVLLIATHLRETIV